MFQPSLQDQLGGKNVLHRAKTRRALGPTLIKQALGFNGGERFVHSINRQAVASLQLTAEFQNLRADGVFTAIVLIRQANHKANGPP